MELFDNIKNRQCEANKKVSYSQKSSIETKKSTQAGRLESNGQVFPILNGEVIESALFERITRDCSGKEIRKKPVRRFRKVGSDEWFTISAFSGNNRWDRKFSIATDEEAINQSNQNKEFLNIDADTDVSPNAEEIPVEEVETEEVIDSIEEKKSSNNKIFVAVLLIGAAFLAYKLFNKK